VIVFSDKAEVLIPATRSEELPKLEARIQMIQCFGGTEIYSGLELGYNEILRNLNRSQINHIILLTDGRTYGDEDKCLELARNASERGIGISGLGIGSEWNDNFLDELATRTGGSSMYISRSQDIQRALMEKFNRLSRAYADETRFEFHVPEGVEFRYAFRLQPDAGLLPYQSPMLMGPVVRDTSLRILMEFVIQPAALQKNVVTLLEGKLNATLSTQTSPLFSAPLRMMRPVMSEAPTDPPPIEIVEALSRLKLYRLQEQARMELTAGNYDQAAEHLTRLATHLLARGERGLAKTALMEAENIQQKKSFTQQGGKEIKYGTRALLMSGDGKDK
jgi:Ca-activated chloride channel family protein